MRGWVGRTDIGAPSPSATLVAECRLRLWELRATTGGGEGDGEKYAKALLVHIVGGGLSSRLQRDRSRWRFSANTNSAVGLGRN